MEDQEIDNEKVWSAIRYLDPDEWGKGTAANTAATIFAISVLLLIVGGIWVYFGSE